MNGKVIGADVKAWFATGLEELRMALQPFPGQGIQSPLMPGTMGVPTTGEATAQRMGSDLRSLHGTFEVPQQQQAVAPKAQQQTIRPTLEPEVG